MRSGAHFPAAWRSGARHGRSVREHYIARPNAHRTALASVPAYGTGAWLAVAAIILIGSLIWRAAVQ